MMVNILSIPGMGTQEDNFSKDLVSDVQKFTKGKIDRNEISFHEVRPFHEVGVDQTQTNMYDRLKEQNKLDFEFLRKFALSAFGDAATFERGASAGNSIYKQIHIVIKNKIIDINNGEDDKMVIVASSLGVHLISTYIYDADRSKGIFDGMSESEKGRCDLSNLNYLATIGCNLPLFLSGIPRDKIIPFDGSKRADGFIWENYYDRDDVLGWPLKQLSPGYSELVEDFEINSGYTPMSHINYWGDNDFTKPFSRKLIDLYNS